MLPISFRSKYTDSFRVTACVDMDAFYAQAMTKKLGISPSFPLVAVQWKSVIAVNYPAREKGIKRGENIEVCKQKCPEIVLAHVDTLTLGPKPQEEPSFDPTDRDKGKEKVDLTYFRNLSKEIFRIFSKYCKVVEKGSIDEGFFDLTSECVLQWKEKEKLKEKPRELPESIGFESQGLIDKIKNELVEIGAEIIQKARREVEETIGCTCSAGISVNKLMAKIGSGINKPNAQTVLKESDIEATMMDVELKKIRGFGGKVAESLKPLNVEKVSDLLKMGMKELEQALGGTEKALEVYKRCRGFDNEEIREKQSEMKTIFSSKTFKSKVYSTKQLEVYFKLVLMDLEMRIQTFFEETKLFPTTCTLSYFDNQTRSNHSKTNQLANRWSTAQIKEEISQKVLDFIAKNTKAFFPTRNLSIGVSGFKKSPGETYAYSITRFFSNKGSSSENVDGSNFEKKENSPNNEPSEVCETCGKEIPESEGSSHRDFHVAELLDREINPNKPKYKRKEPSFVEVEPPGNSEPKKEKKRQSTGVKGKAKKNPSESLSDKKKLTTFFQATPKS